jgi:hypothetical protein
MELVRRNRDQVCLRRRGQLARALHRIAREQRAHGMGPRGQFGHRLDRADLVVDLHDRNQPGALRDRHRRIDQPGMIDRQHGERGIMEPRGVEHGGMFDGRNRHSAPAGSQNRQIERLGRARGEDHPATGRKQPRHLPTRHLDRRRCRAACAVGAVGLANPMASGPASQGSIAARASGASGVVA